jgi:tRNA(Ile)-lysidine synthase
MSGPDPAVADVRRAVRHALAPVTYAAVSGGADSLALLAALAWEAPRHGVTARCVTVDHGLHPGSVAQAERVALVARGMGVETTVLTVTCDGDGEDAARRARYAALDRLDGTVLLGHTRDDQAETVLLGLARGSGARSLAGMPERRGHYVRPFLHLARETTVRACAALGLTPWHDPANDDPRFARARVRSDALPTLEKALGPGVAEALARTADLLRDDADALDALAATHGLHDLADLPRAIRTRVLRREAIAAGCPPSDLTYEHVAVLDSLGSGQEIHLPGGVRAFRRDGAITFGP